MGNGLEEALALIEESKQKKRNYNTSWMKERRKTWTEEEWQKHRDRTNDYSKRNRVRLTKKNRKRVNANKDRAIALLGGVCFDCKQGWHRNVFDFHHEDMDNKDELLSSLWPKSWDKIEAELNKCILLCANCHRMRHAKDQELED